jgi:hypothetical protein
MLLPHWLIYLPQGCFLYSGAAEFQKADSYRFPAVLTISTYIAAGPFGLICAMLRLLLCASSMKFIVLLPPRKGVLIKQGGSNVPRRRPAITSIDVKVVGSRYTLKRFSVPWELGNAAEER